MQGLTIPGIDNLPQFNLANEPIIGTILKPIESAFMMAGLTTPSRRLAGVAAATGLALYIIKPSQFFAGSTPRPWSMWASEDMSALNPVPVPWWMAAVLAGTGAAIFL